MGNSYKGNQIIAVLMKRDNMTRHEATAELLHGRKMVLEHGESPEDVLADFFGLEMDYIFDLLL